MRNEIIFLFGLTAMLSLAGCPKKDKVSALPEEETEEQATIAADAEFEKCVYSTVETKGTTVTLDVIQTTCCAELPNATYCKNKAAKSAKSTLKYEFHNSTGQTLYARMGAKTRGMYWPSATEQYEIGPDETTLGLTCDTGEEVCWGAWKPENKLYYWGAGPGVDYKCVDCCHACDGSTLSAGFAARPEAEEKETP